MDHAHGQDNEKILAHMPSTENCKKIADVFSRISDGTRLKILMILCHSRQCVTNIAQLCQMSSPAVAHHLRILKDAGLIKCEREGKEMYYFLGDTEECKAIHSACDSLFNIKCFGQDG